MSAETELLESIEDWGIRFTGKGPGAGVKWSFANFSTEAGRLRSWMAKNLVTQLSLAPKKAYFDAQQECIEADFICKIQLDALRQGPYLDITFRRDGSTVRAKALLLFGRVQGVFWRRNEEDRFNLPSLSEVLELLRLEAETPSFNFCTIFGDV